MSELGMMKLEKGDPRHEKLAALRKALAQTIKDHDADLDDAIMVFANLLGDAMAQAYGDDACGLDKNGRRPYLEAICNIVHAAIHVSLDMQEGGYAGRHLH